MQASLSQCVCVCERERGGERERERKESMVTQDLVYLATRVEIHCTCVGRAEGGTLVGNISSFLDIPSIGETWIK